MTPSEEKSTMGFSLMEMLIVVVIIGLTTLFMFPRAESMWNNTQVRGARSAVVNMVNGAKIAARQGNMSAFFIVNGDQIRVERNSQVILQQHLGSEFRVNVASTAAAIAFDPRGLVTPSGTTTTIVLSRGGFSDSVVVDGYGRVRR